MRLTLLMLSLSIMTVFGQRRLRGGGQEAFGGVEAARSRGARGEVADAGEFQAANRRSDAREARLANKAAKKARVDARAERKERRRARRLRAEGNRAAAGVDVKFENAEDAAEFNHIAASSSRDAASRLGVTIMDENRDQEDAYVKSSQGKQADVGTRFANQQLLDAAFSDFYDNEQAGELFDDGGVSAAGEDAFGVNAGGASRRQGDVAIDAKRLNRGRAGTFSQEGLNGESFNDQSIFGDNFGFKK